ncbi:MAG: UDP-N-acetylmuramate--L-alanine ligase [Acidimicrobiia bacterium]
MKELIGFSRVHVVGIGGYGMSGLAKLLAQSGIEVTGSDLKPSRASDALAELGVATWIGHRPESVPEVELVVASSAVPESDPELRAAADVGIPVWQRPRLLAAITEAMPGIGFTGTHGKTTSTAMAVAAWRALGEDPSFMVGGDLPDLNTNAHLGDRELFLIEADEAFGTFLSLELTGLTVTGVEADHLDHYGTLGALEDAFAAVAGEVDGPVVVCIDDAGGRGLAERVGALTWGTSPDADWVIDAVEHGAWQVRFRLTGRGRSIDVEIPKPGLHIARDAAGVLALAAELGNDPAEAATGLKDFAGVRRRFEVRARVRGVTIVDDYAHHPTEIGAVLAAARVGPWSKVWAVFQPHRYSRTAELASSFGRALAVSDHVVITDVYGAGEVPIPGVTGHLVADAVLNAGGERVAYQPDRRQLARHLASIVGDGDLVLMMGAGDITSAADELATLLEAAP